MTSARPALLGRDDDLARVEGALAQVRVLTLTGPAGVGKTSLARQVAGRAARAVVCELADAASLDGVLSSVAAALGVRAVDAKDTVESKARIRSGLVVHAPLLLVLDNCEHVATEVDEVVQIALEVGEVRCLLTSREPLFAADETLFEVDQLTVEAAVALLFARGREVSPAFGERDEEAEAARRVVDRLDRLPLAIELFAARLDVLSIAELEDRLDAPLRLLRRPRGDERHRDVAAALRCSWDLLSSDERATLMTLAVCRGGAGVELLEAMRTRLASGPDPADLLDDLASLQRKHLLVGGRDGRGRARYHLLETVRAFVEGEITASGALAGQVRAHAEALLSQRALAERGAGGLLASARDFENLMAAHRRCRAVEPLLSARAGLALHQHFLLHGPMNVHLDILDAALAEAMTAGDRDVQRALFRARGDVRRKVGRLHAANVDLDEAEARSTSDVERSEVASSMAMLRMVESEFDAAVGAIERAIHLAEQAEDPRALGNALQRAGAIHLFCGAYPLVEERCLRGLAALKGVDDLRATTNALTYLGIARLDLEDRERAEAAFVEARAMYASVDDTWSMAVCDAYLAVILLDGGDVDGALPALTAAYHQAQAAGHARLEAFVDAARGIACHLAGDLDEAEQCCRRAVGLGLAVRDVLSTTLGAAHLAAALAAKGGSLDEARHFMDTAHRGGQLLPNPTGRAGLAAIEAVLALAEGDLDAARALAAKAGAEPLGVHRRFALRVLAVTEAAREARAAGQGAAVVTGGAGAVGAEEVGLVLRVRSDARVVVLPSGDRVDLTRRGPLRLILAGLVDAHARGEAVSVTRMVELGWPGQRISTEAAHARVYTAVRTLRRLGLDALLVTRDDGYVFTRAAEVVVDDDLG